MNQATEKPIFIVGNPRSGTTLLRLILCSHPRIFIPEETGFIPFLLKDAQSELNIEQTRAVLRRIGRLNTEWDGMVTDVEGFFASLPRHDLQHILEALYQKKIAETGAVRWGDKTPSYVLYLPTIDRIFPNAQIIHLIRDGRDATLSAMQKWGFQRWYMDPLYLLRNWARHVEMGRKARDKLGEQRYLEIHYEKLVQLPQPTIEQICDFLREELHPEMLNHTKLANSMIKPGGNLSVKMPISTVSVQRWKREMSTFDLKMADQIVGDTLVENGYELARLGPFSIAEKLKLLLLSSKFLLVDVTRQALRAWGILTLNREKRRSGIR